MKHKIQNRKRIECLVDLDKVLQMHVQESNKGKAPPGRKRCSGDTLFLTQVRNNPSESNGFGLLSIENQKYNQNKLSKFYHN